MEIKALRRVRCESAAHASPRRNPHRPQVFRRL